MTKFIKLVTSTNVLEVLFLLLLSCTPFLWVGNGWVVMGHDSGFRFNINHHMQQLWNTWNPTVNTGIDWSLYKGFLLIQLPEFILQNLLGSLEVAQPLILSFWFFLILMGMYIAVRGFFPERKYWFLRLYTSIFWGFNFYILQGWFIGERAKFSLYAALPISIYILYALFQKKISIIVGGVLFGLLYFFLNGGGSPPLFGASAVVWFISWLVFSFSSVRKEGLKKGITFSLKVIATLGIFFVLFNSYWLLLQVDLVRGTYTTAVAQEGGIDGLIAWEREISKYTSIPNLIRLQGIPDWYGNINHSYAAGYLTNPILIVVSLIPFMIIIGGVIVFRRERMKNRLVILCFCLLVVGLFFSAGSHPPTGKIYLLLMQYLPGFAIFRSSFYKFAPVVWFSIIMLSGLYLLRFLELIKDVKNKRFVSMFVLGILLLYHYPFFTNRFFQFDKQFSTRVQVPAYVKETGNYLQTQVPEQGRILLLPAFDHGFINKPIDTYNWGFYSLDALPRSITTRSVVANDGGNETITLLYDFIKQNNTDETAKIMQLIGITHVLYRSDVRFSSESTALQGENALVTMIDMYKDPVFQKGNWYVFATGYQPVSTAIKKDVMSISGTVHKEAVMLASSSSTIVRTQSSSDQFYRNAIQAECFYCAPNEYSQFQEAITFPPAPSRVRQLFAKRNKIIFNTPQQEIDYVLSNSFQQLRLKEYSQYTQSLDRMDQVFNTLSVRDQIVYAARIMAFLKRQKEWVNIQPEISSELITKLQGLSDKMASHMWISDEAVYRFGAFIDIQDYYEVTTFPSSPVKINMIDYESTTDMLLPVGYVKIEVDKDQSLTIPSVYVVSKTTTLPAKSLFIYPYSFDTRWKLMNGNSIRSSEYLTQGYANGWIVEEQDVKTLTVVYGPQEIFYRGVLISLVSVCVGVGILFVKRNSFRKKI